MSRIEGDHAALLDELADQDPIVIADGGVRCEYCGQVFDRGAAATTSLPSTTLFRCPDCER
jgi:DNA-directed RNA polymerase subunit RPC12/RpoP